MLRRLTAILIVIALAAWLQPAVAGSSARSSGASLGEQGGNTQPLVIVVNRSNPIDDLSLAELRRIFLGTRSHWANGRRITLVMRDPGEPERRIMLRDVCGMSEDQLKNHFLHGLFTGEILVSPKILSTPAGVRKFIFNVPGAIGYLRVSDLDDSVKVVRIDELLPDDKGYKLHIQSQAGN
jgi:ABC-type phosphate transport system substrate-binding protein